MTRIRPGPDEAQLLPVFYGPRAGRHGVLPPDECFDAIVACAMERSRCDQDAAELALRLLVGQAVAYADHVADVRQLHGVPREREDYDGARRMGAHLALAALRRILEQAPPMRIRPEERDYATQAAQEAIRDDWRLNRDRDEPTEAAE